MSRGKAADYRTILRKYVVKLPLSAKRQNYRVIVFAQNHAVLVSESVRKILAIASAPRLHAYDFATNWLQCEGLTVASSESLTHAAVYESDPTTCAVIHCHDMKLWTALLHKVPTTPEKVEYGTPEMAYAVRGLFDNTDVLKKKIFVMAGHEGGVVAFGRDLRSAFAQLTKERKK